ncbi:cytochrome P450 [Parafrankia sp. FMc2]|uniref:cytochrome P450 n=1 Tax=Parafrankia sp. FMc2 TaxID=3233196 RepID=UPI0034D55E22
MTTEDIRATDAERKQPEIELNRHGLEYRDGFEAWAKRLHVEAPIAWNATHGGYWFVSGNQQVFDLARRADLLSNENDGRGTKHGYFGINIPHEPNPEIRRGRHAGFLEMDPPEQRHYRNALNAYLSPAAVARWQPVMDEITRASLDEVIETGRIDFVDHLANVVPAVLTMAMLGLPLTDWVVYCEPAHAAVYTPADSPDWPRVQQQGLLMGQRLFESIQEARSKPRPGMLDALLNANIVGEKPDDEAVVGAMVLLIGGGFDTTTSLTANALNWLSEHPDQRECLVRDWETLRDSATEEFLRFYTPAQGNGRTISQDAEVHGTQFREGDRLWVSWAMANRDETVFEDPHTIHLDRKGNRHSSFGLGIHRCIGSNVARATFKTMLKAVLDRMPDFACDPGGAVRYESTHVINGMQHLPATFTPGKRLGPGLEETIEKLQRACDEQRLAEPVTVRKQGAKLAD